jgi:plasmid stability protein
MEKFRTEGDNARRRDIIRQARHKGSMPAEVRGELRHAALVGRLDIKVTTVIGASFDGTDMHFECADDTTLTVARAVLTTGFEQKRPGGAWLDKAILDLGLPLSECGFPIVEPSLRWHGGLYVTGTLAELELGPAARNIIGARHAAERLKA